MIIPREEGRFSFIVILTITSKFGDKEREGERERGSENGKIQFSKWKKII